MTSERWCLVPSGFRWSVRVNSTDGFRSHVNTHKAANVEEYRSAHKSFHEFDINVEEDITMQDRFELCLQPRKIVLTEWFFTISNLGASIH